MIKKCKHRNEKEAQLHGDQERLQVPQVALTSKTIGKKRSMKTPYSSCSKAIKEKKKVVTYYK